MLPLLPQASQLYIYFNCSSILIDVLKQFIVEETFVASIERQQIYLDVDWLKNKASMKRYSSDVLLQFRRLIAQNTRGKFKNYIKINLKAIPSTKNNQKYNHCLFVPKKTKLVIQKAHHYDLNQILKIIKLPQLYETIYSTKIYQTLKQRIFEQIQYKPQKSMIFLKVGSGLGISSFIHYLGQKNEYNIARINCKYFASEKELIDKIKQSDSYSSTIIYIKNIEWLLQVGNNKNDQQQKMKRIVRDLQQQFFKIAEQTLTSHIMIIQYNGNFIKLDMSKNAKLIEFQPTKKQKTEILQKVIDYYRKKNDIKLKDKQQVLNLAVNSLGWATFSKVLKRLQKNRIQNLQIKTQSVLVEIGKIVSLQKVQNIKNVTWKDVGGLQNAKQQILQTILLPSLVPQIFDDNIKPRTGLLFFGPPGTGKTMLGKCIANQCKMSFISVKGPQLLNMYIGESQKNVREVFQRAAASKPCIIFMDELDALIPKRGQSSDSNQVMDRIVSELLTQMDKAPRNGTFVIGATNRPDLLDPSIMRPGRFDKQIYLGITKDIKSRIQILKAQTRHINLTKQFNFQKIVQNLPENFTGADFYGLTSRSIMTAAERHIEALQKSQNHSIDEDVVITQQDFLKVTQQIKPSVSIQELKHYQKLKQQYK